MKHLICAVAASPLLIAATPAPPAAPEAPRDGERRVVLIQSLDEMDGFEARHAWSEADHAALREAIDNLREVMAGLPGGPEGAFRFEWRDMEGMDRDARRERVRVMTRRAREEANEWAEAARESGRMARFEGERARMIALRASARGMQTGLDAIDEALERGEVYRHGAWRPMTEAERADMETARQGLADSMERLRTEGGVVLEDDSEGERRVMVMRREVREGDRPRRGVRTERRLRIEDRDGRLRVWVDGQELEDDALTAWLNSEEGQRVLSQRPEPPLRGGE